MPTSYLNFSHLNVINALCSLHHKSSPSPSFSLSLFLPSPFFISLCLSPSLSLSPFPSLSLSLSLFPSLPLPPYQFYRFLLLVSNTLKSPKYKL